MRDKGTVEEKKTIRDIKAKIQATAEFLAQFGEMKRPDGRSLAKTITDLFDDLRELEASLLRDGNVA